MEVSGETVDRNALLLLERAQVRGLLVQALARSGRFVLPGGAARAEGAPAWRMSLEVPYTRESSRAGEGGTVAEVGVSLRLEPERGEDARRYELAGIGEARVEEATPAGRVRALRAALLEALRQVSEAAVLQLTALGQTDAQLSEGLRSDSSRVREYSLRTLADRRHPAAAPLLVARLKESDPAAIRSAMGALVEMRARSAVPDLIELARGKEAGFVQEVLFALGEIGGEEAEAYLYTVAQGHDQPTVQAAAQQALDTLAASRKLTRTTSP